MRLHNRQVRQRLSPILSLPGLPRAVWQLGGRMAPIEHRYLTCCHAHYGLSRFLWAVWQLNINLCHCKLICRNTSWILKICIISDLFWKKLVYNLKLSHNPCLIYLVLCARSSPALATSWIVAHQAPLSMGLIQGRILEWVSMPSSRGSSKPRDRICVSRVSCIGRWALAPPRIYFIYP